MSAAVALASAYAPRPLSDLSLLEHDGWWLKVTGVSAAADRPRSALVAAARRAAVGVLPWPAVTPVRYGVGFVGVHDGQDACFVFVDWWESGNELHHHTFLAPADDPGSLGEVTGTGFVACAWDLAVMWQERQAWVETVLADPHGPDREAYLGRRPVGPV